MLNNSPKFREVQKFRQFWVSSLVLIPAVVTLYGAYKQLVLGQPFGNNPASDTTMIILTIIFGFLFPLFIFSMKLVTEVRDDGVYVRFFPFHLSFKKFGYADITSYKSVHYSALREYGGWGIRYGRTGKAYNISGNDGIMLEFRNGKHLLIGSQRTHEFLLALEQSARTA
ncbi:DUF6141 family protein [Methanococcoides methylutens]|uniref:Bacterial Pleckstrin homology domain-containing protein n=1 Tax=Methanococcoides methylutens MM1 TaxID=1434104 RepID=A0A0E3X1U0_METMT|nr:DUF6141 family protein [Methanococcoides methylutens]AKB85545.1 hypothetical protein MCMEM_1492 [Methanococcoides methylutens MM1]